MYAKQTRVPIEVSKCSLEKLLRKAGATQIGSFSDVSHASVVMFRLADRFVKLKIAPRSDARNPEQEERRVWRVLLLLVKAKLETIEAGLSSVEREFLADVMTADGQTVGELMRPVLAASYESGTMEPMRALLGRG